MKKPSTVYYLQNLQQYLYTDITILVHKFGSMQSYIDVHLGIRAQHNLTLSGLAATPSVPRSFLASQQRREAGKQEEAPGASRP